MREEIRILAEALKANDRTALETLAKIALSGSREAFDVLVPHVTERLLSFFRRRGVSEHDAEELTQQAWLKLHMGIDGFDREKPFMPYMFTIALNCWRDRGRREKRDPTMVQAVLEEVGEYVPPDLEIVNRELVEQMDHCLNTVVDEKQRAYCRHRFYEGRTVRETADVMGVAAATVVAGTQSAIRNLLDCIGLQ